MFKCQFFKSIGPLTRAAAGVGFLVVSLLFGCGGDETMKNPTVETVGDEAFDVTPNYFPIAVGNRWAYRNPDGSEWEREVIDKEFDSHRAYYFFHYAPPIKYEQLDFLKTPLYAPTLTSLILRAKNNDINETVRKTIRQSGSVPPAQWTLGHTSNDGVWRRKQKHLDALVYLYFYNAKVDSHSELTLLRFPLIPGHTYKVLDIRLSGNDQVFSYTHSFEAKGVIMGKIGDAWESVETPAGTFEDCLKIQYEARHPTTKTKVFRHQGGISAPEKLRRVLESDIQEEFTSLCRSIIPQLGLGTMWLAPGVGPIKIETPNGIAELIDYEIKPVASGQ